MKKTTKTNKTPAPATKPTAPAPALKSTIAPKIIRRTLPTPAEPALVTKPKGAKVTITAKTDVGFGNALFIRGEGAGLSWSRGRRLDCVSNDTWSVTLPGVEAPIAFKLLLNDDVWSADPNYSASPGDAVTVTPAF
jgi:hypothetical protein